MNTGGFYFEKRIGEGNFGSVWKVTDLGLNCVRALKRIPASKVINRKNFFQEAQTLKAVEHPNIVTVYAAGMLNPNEVAVTMEYLPKGSLQDEASGNAVPLSRAKKLLIDVLRGLEHAHRQNIVHRDIKPGNIMIGENGIGKLSDFGLAIQDISNVDVSNLQLHQYLMHVAPEVRRFEDHTELADIYACGITLYRIVNGDSYLPVATPRQAMLLARQGKYPDRTRYREYVTLRMCRVIDKAMSVDPSDRCQSADEMRHALEQVATAVDWTESQRSEHVRWDGIKQRDVRIRVDRQKQNNGKWAVVVQKGSGQLRKDNNLSEWDLTKGGAQRVSRRILQDFVNGRY